MNTPTLVILAAGMGSRFGGLKQITSVDSCGHAIIDFSLYDAYAAGFRRVVFVIKHEIAEDFINLVGRRVEKFFEVHYAYQEIDMLPEGYSVPETRIKPWGTAHAVYCCREYLDCPYAVINADDFYGRQAYEALYGFLSGNRGDFENAMVAYMLRNTVTENGYVARGICCTENGELTDVIERTHIEKRGENAVFTESDGAEHPLSGDCLVSMNCWAFNKGFNSMLSGCFGSWLDENLPVNPDKAEYFLPYVVNIMIKSGKGTVKILDCDETWYGMTYKDDMLSVRNAISKMIESGKYPRMLLEELR